MSLRFRLGLAADLPACVALLREEGCFRAGASLWPRLPGLWRSMLDSPAVQFVVLEDIAAPPAARLWGCAISVIVRDDFVAELRGRGRPWSGALLYERIGSRASPLLGEHEIGRANAGDGVDVLLLHHPLRHRAPDDPKLEATLNVGMAAFYFCHAGFHVRSVLWEVYGDHFARLLAGGGYRQVDDFAAHAAASALPPERRPFLMGLHRHVAGRRAYDANALWLFRREPPTMRFSSAQRRLLRLALTGMSDRDIAAALDVSENAVRQGWRAIQGRVQAVLPALFPDGQALDPVPAAAGGRGPARRRVVLDYLRQHMHELRPWAG